MIQACNHAHWPFGACWLNTGKWFLTLQGSILSLSIMPRGKKRGKKNSTGRQVLDVSGFLTRLGVPVPRLPFLIGSANNLPFKQSVYPTISVSVALGLSKVSIVAGALATAINIDETLIPSFNTRFASTFRECAILGARIELRMTNVANPTGLVIVFLNEKTSASPVASEAQDAPHLDMLVSSTESPTRHLLDWKARDLLDLEWSAIASVATPVTLKLFASVATTLTAAGTTADILISGAMQIGFRGWA
jgi:hypothetical protein